MKKDWWWVCTRCGNGPGAAILSACIPVKKFIVRFVLCNHCYAILKRSRKVAD